VSLPRIFVAAAALLTASAAGAETLYVPIVSVTIERPPTWRQWSLPRSPEYEPADLDGEPVVLLMRESRAGSPLGPTVTLSASGRRADAQAGWAPLLEDVASEIARGAPDLRLLEGPAPSARFAPGGAYLRFAFTARDLPVTGEIWAVPRGEFVLLYATLMAPSEPEESRAEALAILDSIRSTPVP
jgi:hypothetical protein